MMSRTMKIVTLLAVLGLALPYCKKSGINTTEKAGGASMATGKAVYDSYCLECHGPNGEGDGPAGMALNPKPRNYAKDGFKYGSSLEEVRITVREGIEGTAMQEWREVLTEDEITEVSNFVKTLASQTIE